MAPIRKAKSYVIYLTALLISSLFTVFHKTSPAWAEDAKADRNAQIFSTMYKGQTVVAQATTGTTTPSSLSNIKLKPVTVAPPLTAGERDVPSIVGDQRIMPLTPLSPEKANDSVNEALNSIYLKLGRNEPLTMEENALIMSAETAHQYKDLQNQITVLTQIVKQLQAGTR